MLIRRRKSSTAPLIYLERRYYISSRLMSAEAFAKAVRGHWGIETRLHWMLDVNFGEDAATVRKDFAADNRSRLKKIVLNVLRLENRNNCHRQAQPRQKAKARSVEGCVQNDN